ncbi:hypothetical protein Sste5346_007260 [Sporothrix stenoceras]|uniref:Uncharacterized protein n=1 Tax=Sporothrix stenoceras TaxID=5173 RepID=A0ABR3YUP1_9PEZI
MVFGFLHSSKSSKGSKPPSRSRMTTGYYEQPPAPRPSTSSSLHRRNAIKSSHSSSGQYANRIEVIPWTRPGTGYRQAPPTDMSYGMPPSSFDAYTGPSSSSSSRPPTLRGQDAFYHESGCPVDLSSMSGGPQMNFTPAHHSSSSRRDSRRDSNGISPVSVMFPPEVQRILGPDFASDSRHSSSRSGSSRSGSSRSHGSSHGSRGLPPQLTAVSSRARSARQYAMDNDTSCFPSDYAGVFQTHGRYPYGYNPFVAPHNQPNYNPHPSG